MKNGKNLKKLIGLTLAAALAAGALASCGSADKRSNADADDKEAVSSPNTTESTFSPKGADQKPSASPSSSPTPTPQTAEEAANDTTAISNEIESIQALIDEELYDDALMQIRALLTKNLSDADKEKVNEYEKMIKEKMNGGLSD